MIPPVQHPHADMAQIEEAPRPRDGIAVPVIVLGVCISILGAVVWWVS